MEDLSILDQIAAELGVELGAEAQGRFKLYMDALVEWNSRFNLTAIREPEEIQRKLFGDALTLLDIPEIQNVLEGGERVIDVGSGAGFPGIPLKILFPGIQVTLLEATRKKTEFLSYVVDLLKLADTTVVWDRAEQAAHLPEHREQYDLAVARAVASLPALAELCLPFVRIGGTFVAEKGALAEEEVKTARRAIQILGGKYLRLEQMALPGIEEPWHVVLVAKKWPTPAEYPRRAGMPASKPL
ncbi:MAG: 16S rRNA (guanine(527)-N(7))-methyltransferase RsmG [Chloroflexi bacterium]|nr:16S rRNA (guanine(527)-N(7))-methyltransferase RsmG [Chloroflexota bacterium]